MSGRVRWYAESPRVTFLFVGRTVRGKILVRGDVRVAWCRDDLSRREFTRRSDAKRWLLARAAGLAEVPRRIEMPTILVVNLGGEAQRPSPGWRIARQWQDFERGNGDVIVTAYERNRRRR